MGGVNCFIGWKRKWKKWIEKQILPPCMMGCIRYQTLSGLTYQEVKEVGGFVSIEDCVSDKRLNLKLYALGRNENLISAATAELKLKNFINIQNRQEKRKQRLVEWKEKAPHGQFLRETETADDGNDRNKGSSSVKQKAFYVQLKNSLYELMPSSTQLIRQAILHSVYSM